MKSCASILLPVVFASCVSTTSGQDRTLFRFDTTDAAKAWQTVNDGVMGGRSSGRFRISKNKTMEFFGTLSLENNGGFASVRARGTNLALKNNEVIVLRVRGDGREYNLNLYTRRNLGGYSWRQSFRTQKGEWTLIRLPVDKFVAAWRGRTYADQKLDPAKVSGLGILLGDKKPGTFRLEVDWIKAGPPVGEMFSVAAEGTYKHHLQGICTDNAAIYWSFTTTLVKTNRDGKLLRKIAVANHHGDLCHHDGKLYVAVNLGKFNDPEGNADSWVYVYNAETLAEIARHKTPEVFHGAGGIGFRNGHFYVVGGLPNDVPENYVYEYDATFRFVKKHVVSSGHTHLGIQTAAFAHDRWWFGCYGDPKILLVTDSEFRIQGRFELDCSLGIEGLPNGRLLVGSGRCDAETGCVGSARTAVPDQKAGYRLGARKP